MGKWRFKQLPKLCDLNFICSHFIFYIIYRVSILQGHLGIITFTRNPEKITKIIPNVINYKMTTQKDITKVTWNKFKAIFALRSYLFFFSQKASYTPMYCKKNIHIFFIFPRSFRLLSYKIGHNFYKNFF